MSDRPRIHLIGNAHLDPAWMWMLDEGIEAFTATCRSVLDRMEETPEFVFTCSSAAHYEFVEKTDPALFERIRQAVVDGRWILVGGWWVEPDCNLPSGESFIRQALLGQRYFFSRFGKIAKTGYNIDSFGHNANLPQLLRGAGIENYVFMRPELEETQLPSALFRWKSRSSDEVLAYRIPLHYSNFALSVNEKLQRLPDYPLYDAVRPWMLFYGVGNHGGGPTKAQIAEIIQAQSSDSAIVFSDPDKFFEEVRAVSLTSLESLASLPPLIEDEIQPHAIGCYSAHSEAKSLNREAEHQLLIAERVGVLAELLTQHTVDAARLRDAWCDVALNQFHDLLGGVAIKEAMDEVVGRYQRAIMSAKDAERMAIRSLANQIDTSGSLENLIVFNPRMQSVDEFVEFEIWTPEASERGEVLHEVTLIAPDGSETITQRIPASGRIGDDRVRFVARLAAPPLGWRAYRIERRGASMVDAMGADGPSENSVARFTLYRDESDTWAHGVRSFDDKYGVGRVVGEELRIENGPLSFCNRARWRFDSAESNVGLDSELTLDTTRINGSDVQELRISVDWREHQSILRLSIPHGLANPIARYEIPGGSIERTVGPEEWPGQSWVTVHDSVTGMGIALINDSKYSYRVTATDIEVILARSVFAAHHAPPHPPMRPSEQHTWLDMGEQQIRSLVIPFEQQLPESEMTQRAAEFLEPCSSQLESAHAGSLPSEYSGVRVTPSSLDATVLKVAEDRNGYVLRVAERDGLNTEASFGLDLFGLDWESVFAPYEIKTFLIQESDEGGYRVMETNFIELQI